MTGDELRKKFLQYFEDRGHTVVSSYALVPKNDPTLMFTNAGMVQFKDVFLGEEKRDYNRAVSVQKCVRAGGKHNDLEMVGRTSRHHTFFEMLGNFSFGDYFKKEAIQFGWEFLTDVIGLPRDRLYISVFEDDDDAFNIWVDDIKMPRERIYKLGEKDNFWAMGSTGPCGPCSEIFIDQGKAIGCGQPSCEVGCDCDRFLEIWNLVFMQYDRDKAGKLTPLPHPCIDTGMGLERLAAVVQGRTTNYDTDLMMSIITVAARITGKEYGKQNEVDVSLRVLTDHARASVFLISDGVIPSNEGRGYVLRKIIRRALRHGKLLEQKGPFFHRITSKVIEDFKGAYPELSGNSEFIQKVVINEEESFSNTLHYGTQRLEEIIEKVSKDKLCTIPGEEIFKLYDTYGFPTDLVEETAKDAGLTLDMEGYTRAMNEQRTKATNSWKGSGEKEVPPFYREFLQSSAPTVFEGYGTTQGQGKILAILKDHAPVESASTGDEIEFLTDKTPFYGESGGQTGDSGRASNENVQLSLDDATKPLPGLIVHKAKIISGTMRNGETLKLEVHPQVRGNTALNHSATHLLQAALKEVLGEHIKQAGSLVASDRLRFDYTHFSPLTDKERVRIESRVNEKIRDNIQVATQEMDIDTAIKEGAVALFGEKYGDTVRVVDVLGFSKELCGGTHVNATGDIGLFRITSEGSIASGVRRIEAVTGAKAYNNIQAEQESLAAIRVLLKAPSNEEITKLKKLLEKNRQLEKEITTLKEKMVNGQESSGLDEVQKIGDVSVLIKKIEGMDAKTLRTFIDNTKNQLKSGIVVVGSVADGKVSMAVGVTKDLTGKYHAGNIIKSIAVIVGGSGGGRPDMAQAGGPEIEKLDQALKKAEELIRTT
uniref:Alanine--tRNA ligase n=1 Tax=uncultured marine Nitrospinaceae bacterium TaxID=482920 RepID=A4GJ52_9BACT|nr:putative alanyl-tRNA synthetase class IIc [uncultured marine Nitrospinaceae bacterium]